ncbi:MAG TPA: YcgN family cysteine cluster protein [Bauldia sp.]|nr:YcgN family cysteine cluster protein [Bauldia sp.]
MPARGRGAAPAGEAEGGEAPFWKRKRLHEMSREEWESLCDGCGRCCLNKLEDMETGEIYWTDVACRLLDDGTCRCKDYEHRQEHVPDCISLTPEIVPRLSWLPPTCAYRLVAEGRDLYWWHPLVSGDPLSVHMAGISVRGQTRSEADIPAAALEEHMVTWPGEDPMQPPEPARKRKRR